MIKKLKIKDMKETARIYNKGLQMEIPKGYATLEETIKELKKINCFVHKSKNKIDGLITFKKRKDGIVIDFICSLKLRKGIGKELINKLIVYSINNKINNIYSNVSNKDKRVLKFYDSLGFKKYGEYYENKNLLLYKIKLNLE